MVGKKSKKVNQLSRSKGRFSCFPIPKNSKSAQMDSLTVYLIIAGLTLALVIGLIIEFDLIHKLDILIPRFSWGDDDNSPGGVFDDVYDDDGSGRCKKVEGLYSLNGGKLEVWYGGVWHDVDGEVAMGYQYNWYLIKKGLEKTESEMSLSLFSEIHVELHNLGLYAIGENGGYLYIRDEVDELLRIVDKNGIASKTVEFDKLSEIDNSDERAIYEKIFEEFREILDQKIIILDKEYDLNLEIITSDDSYLYIKYAEEGGKDTGYAIDSEGIFYMKDIVDDWMNLNDELPEFKGVELKEKKEELINAGCSAI